MISNQSWFSLRRSTVGPFVTEEVAKHCAIFSLKKIHFSILIVLGVKEAENLERMRSEINENIMTVFDATEQLHDGRWMWVRILNKSDFKSLVLLLNIKKKPKKSL